MDVNQQNEVNKSQDIVKIREDVEDQRYPECNSCRKSIKEQKCVQLGQMKYHINHFKCSVCVCELVSKPFFVAENQLYCQKDYKQKIAPICHGCDTYISGKYVSAKNISFHQECLLCGKCGDNIMEGDEHCEFFFDTAKKEIILCVKCKRRQAVKCVKCKDRIMNNDEVEVQKKIYHLSCAGLIQLKEEQRTTISQKYHTSMVTDTSNMLEQIEIKLQEKHLVSFQQLNSSIGASTKSKVTGFINTLEKFFSLVHKKQEQVNDMERATRLSQREDEGNCTLGDDTINDVIHILYSSQENVETTMHRVDDELYDNRMIDNNEAEQKYGMTFDQLNRQFEQRN